MEPYVLARGEGPAIWMFDALDTVKADAEHTGGRFALFEFLDVEGSTVRYTSTNGGTEVSMSWRASTHSSYEMM